MIRFDFLHDAPVLAWEFRWSGVSRRYRAVLAAVGVVAAFFCGAWTLERGRIAQARYEQQSARERFDRSRIALAALQLQWKDVGALLETDRGLRRLRLSGPDAAVRLAEIGNLLPPNATLRSLSAGGSGYACKGSSPNLVAFGDLLAALAHDNALPKPSAVRVNRDTGVLAPLTFEIAGGSIQ